MNTSLRGSGAVPYESHKLKTQVQILAPQPIVFESCLKLTPIH